MKKLWNHLALAAVLLFACLLFAPAADVQAANPTKVSLTINKSYTKYDITGDQKADTLRIKTTLNSTKSWITKTSVIVNGKTLASYSGYAEQVTAQLYTLSNGKPFLYLFAASNNGDGPVSGIFQYKSGKLNQIINLQTLFKPYGSHLGGYVYKVSGNAMYLKLYSMSWTVGPSDYIIKYTYKSGTLKKVSNNITSIVMSGLKARGYTYVTANYNMRVYTDASLTSTAFTLKKGQKVKFTGAYLKPGKCLMKVQMANGKKGWIKCLTSYPYANQPFAEVQYAG